MSEILREKALESVAAIDLSEGKEFLEEDWGRRAVCDWARLKFQIKLTPDELKDKTEKAVTKLVHGRVLDLYRQREIAFPVMAAMARFMSDRPAQRRRPALQPRRPLSLGRRPLPRRERSWKRISAPIRGRSCWSSCWRPAEASYPQDNQETIDEKLEEAFSGTKTSEPEDAKELADWARAEMGLEVAETALTGVTQDAGARRAVERLRRPLPARDAADGAEPAAEPPGFGLEEPPVHDGPPAFGHRPVRLRPARPEDHVQARGHEGIQGDVGGDGGQGDGHGLPHRGDGGVPGVGVGDRRDAPRRGAARCRRRQRRVSTNGTSEKKQEPIRNRKDKVGRNDPCPCGSGKKYKNCHMREAAV